MFPCRKIICTAWLDVKVRDLLAVLWHGYFNLLHCADIVLIFVKLDVPGSRGILVSCRLYPQDIILLF